MPPFSNGRVVAGAILLTIHACETQATPAPNPLPEPAAQYDVDRNELIDAEESGPQLRRRFPEFDADDDGFLDAVELGRYFQSVTELRRERARTLAKVTFEPMKVITQIADVQVALEQMVASLDLSGAALIAGRGDRILYRGSVGDITPDTVVPLASVSKWVSATVLMRMVESGRASLDAPLKHYLRSIPDHWAEITLRQAFNHTAGFPLGHALRYHPLRPPGMFIEELVALKPAAAAGSTFAYGGTSMQVAAHALEKAGGQSWATLFQRNVATPAGMRRSRYGHSTWDNGEETVQTPNIAGGLHSNAEDMYRLLSVLADRRSRFLTAASISAMETDYTSDLPQRFRPAAANDEWSYGLGLWCEIRDGRRCTLVNSAGAYGSFPWINRETGDYGILVVVGSIPEVKPFAIHLRALMERVQVTANPRKAGDK